jgi:hypothetical protein
LEGGAESLPSSWHPRIPVTTAAGAIVEDDPAYRQQ